MLILVLALFVLAAAAPVIRRGAGGAAAWVLALGPLAALVWLGAHAPTVVRGGVVAEAWPLVPALGMRAAFVLDGLSLLFAVLVAAIGVVVLVYAGRYLRGDTRLARFETVLMLFMASMLGLVLSDDLMTLFVFWEATSITSYLLIGFDHGDERSRAAALRALLVTGGGGLAMLVGFLILGGLAGTWSISELNALGSTIAGHALYRPVLALILLGAFTKSAQVPFHFWLPGAMAAPTPVSAYLHSATMVKAGVFLLARLAPALGGTETWHQWVGLAGAATMFYGAAAALAQRDLKRVLAFTTVSALGTLTLLLGIDTEESVKAAMVFLVVHALYKAALFLVVGTVDHETGTRDVAALGGLWRAMPWTTAAAAAAALSMAGWPPLLGFVAKELVYEAKVGAPQAPWILTALGLAANVLVVASAGIVGWRPFFGAPRATPRPPHEGEPELVVGPLALAAAGVVLGLFPQTLAAPLLASAIEAVHAEPTRVELALWHGINPMLLLSVATFALGGAVYAARRPIKEGLERLGAVAGFGPERIYALALAAVPVVGRMQTRAIQSGYLRRYVLATLAACIAVAAVPLFGRGLAQVPGDLPALLPHEALLALVVIGGAVATATARSRLVALGGLGAVGLGMALVFLLVGGPDLALTQIAVETLTVILFALVLYRLPPLRQLSSLASRARDAAIAIGVGLFFTVLVWTAAAQPHRDDVARALVARSFDEAKGRNVVNVILVDFRALDTLGEITVLTIAALGVVVLLRLRPEVERP